MNASTIEDTHAESARTSVTGSNAINNASGDASTAAWEQELRKCEELGRVAFFAGDTATLSTLWSPELLVNSPLNIINDRAQVLHLLASGRIRHTVYDVVIERIHRYGDVAVVMGRDSVDGPPSGAMMERRFTNVWQLQNPEQIGTQQYNWIMIARHAQVVIPRSAVSDPSALSD